MCVLIPDLVICVAGERSDEETANPRGTIGLVDIEGSLAEIVGAASRWITDAGEVLAIARYSRAAGQRDYVLFDEPEAFANWANSLPADTNLLVLKDFQLDIRGAASNVSHRIPNETDVEWLIDDY